MNRICIFLTTCLISLALPALVFGWIDWETLKTQHFEIIYKPGYEWEAKECLKVSEHYRYDVVKLTGHNIGRTPIVIEDAGILSNGFANILFRNAHIFTYPPNTSSELGSTENWWRAVSLHEYTHLSHTSKTGGIPGLLTNFLGTPFQPNIYSPGWVLEGTAVFSESQFSNYEGRLNDGYFDLYISARISENRFPSLLNMTYLPLEFPSYAGRYIYGSEFFNYLKEKYGKERFAKFFANQGSSLSSLLLGPIFPKWGIDGAAESSFGRSIPSLHQQWCNYELGRNKNWCMDGKRITKQGWRMSYPIIYKNQLYYAQDFYKKTGAGRSFRFSRIIKRDLNSQKEKTVVSLTSQLSSPLRIVNNQLYYSVLEMKRGYANISLYGFGYTSNLHQRDLNTGKDRVLLRDDIRAFTVLDDNRILYSRDQKHRFGSEIWLYSPLDNKSKLMFKTDYLVGEIVSNDSYTVVSARRDWENWNLYLLDLRDRTFIPITKTPFSESSISISKSRVFFTANYNKVYSVYAYDLKTKKFYQLTSGGYASYPAFDSANNDLYFIGLNASGSDLYRKKVDFIYEFMPINYPKSSLPNLSLPQTTEGNYVDVLKTLSPVVHIPIILPTDTTFRSWFLWVWLLGGDALGEHNYNILFANDPVTPEVFFFLSYQSYFLNPVITDFQLDYQNYGLLSMSYPVFNRLKPGFSSLSLSLIGMAYDENFSRRAIAPVVSTSLRYPTATISANFICPMERKLWDSSIERNGLGFIANIRKYVHNSEFDILSQGLYDPDNPDSTGYRIRGYKHPLYTKTGGSITLAYSFPLLRIRRGFWNPNIFFEDIGVTLFSDFDIAQNGRNQISCGTELQLEVSSFFLDAARLIPKIGISINKERTISVHFGLDVGSPLTGGFSNAHRIRQVINRQGSHLPQRIVEMLTPFNPLYN